MNKIRNIIIDLETKYQLFDWKINDVYIWELIRADIFLRLEELEKNESFQENNSLNLYKKLYSFFLRFIRNGIFRNPFFRLKRGGVLIFESGRKYLHKDRYVDIYTYFLEEEIKNKKEKFQKVETNYKYDLLNGKLSNSSHIDFINFASKIHAKFINVKFSNDEEIFIDRIIKEIQLGVKISIPLKDIIISSIRYFKAQHFYYSLLLKKCKPSRVYVVNYVDYFALISVAKKLEIICIELQHGLIIEESLIYHFPNVKDGSLKYFSDIFYVWKDFNLITGKLPISEANIISNPYNHLENMRNEYKHVKTNPKVVLVASQPYYSNYILMYILKNASQMNDYKFYYKLHPMQFECFEESYLAKKVKKLNNVIVLKNEISVYSLLKEAKFTIGIFSTLLYEADMFESIPLVLVPKDLTYSKSLIDSGKAFKINEDISLLDNIKYLI